MSLAGETIVRSFGYGVYLAEVSDGLTAEEAKAQATRAIECVSPVAEVWPDPGSGRHFLAATNTGLPASRYEVSVTLDDDVLAAASRASMASPAGSLIRVRMKMVSLARVAHGHEPVQL